MANQGSPTLRERLVPPHHLGSLEVGEHEDVKQLGAGSGAEGIEPFPKSALEFLG
jgi:hypothetical protein